MSRFTDTIDAEEGVPLAVLAPRGRVAALPVAIVGVAVPTLLLGWLRGLLDRGLVIHGCCSTSAMEMRSAERNRKHFPSRSTSSSDIVAGHFHASRPGFS